MAPCRASAPCQPAAAGCLGLWCSRPRDTHHVVSTNGGESADRLRCAAPALAALGPCEGHMRCRPGQGDHAYVVHPAKMEPRRVHARRSGAGGASPVSKAKELPPPSCDAPAHLLRGKALLALLRLEQWLPIQVSSGRAVQPRQEEGAAGAIPGVFLPAPRGAASRTSPGGSALWSYRDIGGQCFYRAEPLVVDLRRRLVALPAAVIRLGVGL